MRVLDHDDSGVDHRADGDCNPAETHDVGADPKGVHDHEGDQHTNRQHDDCDERAARMQQKDHADQRNDYTLFEKRVFERVDRAVDQVRPVINRQDLHAVRQAAGDFGDLRLDVLDDRQGVGPVALQHDPGDDFAVAVELGQAAPLIRTELDPCHVANAHRRAAVGLEYDCFEVRNTTDISAASHHVLALAHLDDAAADIPVAGTDRLGDFRERDAEGAQLGRIDHDLILLDKAADARDLGDTLCLGQLIPNEPVLD